ncbi:hypothetical protein TREES_T100010197 [Tupaia chinensis]|uniref:PPM-type phosphatase domain-containing protein n=2 Tax=Tupaia chinensis TaxID=246437 RepID=L8YBU7_TUPCH|nr:hypothetical protein TREES_T100010197 [Tupaia chinensis]
MISSNEPYGLLEGQVQTTRGLGFHGNLKLKKSIIPAPQTISIPIDDLCQFLILATNGLWEVLDKKEVTALAMTMFHVYKETYYSTTQNASLSYEPLLYTTGDPNITEPETDIHVLFQYEPHSKENVLDSKYSEYCPYNLENVEKPAAKRINQEPCNRKESCAKSFYEGAAEYVSHELVNAALEAGSRDNVTVMVIFLNGSEYQFLT